MDRLNVMIAGEIALSDEPGATMKKWREIFGITQAELGKYLKISPSTISDYEGNRRKSPGIGVVRRFVEALIAIDKMRGGNVASRLRGEEPEKRFYEIGEFAKSMSAADFVRLIEGKPVANKELLVEKRVYGYTLLDSIKVILEMPYGEFPKLYGTSPERAFIFLEVSTGRSPLVTVRVTQMKPSLIVLHKLKKVDKLAVRIAQVERIPVVVTNLSVEELKKRLSKL